MAITSVKIHPAIGVARVGNSPDEWFVGPEVPGIAPTPPGGFKDAACRVKRQGARFRVFGYDAAGNVEQELTAADATIEWRVHLVNRKAAAADFNGAGPPPSSLRNPAVTGADRNGLVIDPGQLTLSGPDQRELFDAGTFKLPSIAAEPVPLGEVRTDDAGRLIVLGGFGRSASPSGVALNSLFNNHSWFDDTSDGPVSATVTLSDGTVLQALGAWVIVAPPKFAPPIESVVTLWDRLRDAFVNSGALPIPTNPSYTNDVYPILHRATTTAAVRSSASGRHQWSHPVTDPSTRSSIFGRLTSPTSTSQDMPDILQEPGQSDGRLTNTQHKVMELWANGTFVNDWSGVPSPTPAVSPAGLDRAALEACVGAAFFPGIEAGGYLLDTTRYIAPFRLDHAQVNPGDVTARMALPWQTDFNACATDWWPVPRPNNVIPQGTTSYLSWSRGVGGGLDMVQKWHTLGFVVDQPEGFVEAERCDTATITLLTPSLDFVDVPQGYGGAPRRQALAITFEVVAPSVAVTLEYKSGPAHPRLHRHTAGPVVVPVTGASSTALARFFITYQTGATGDVVGDTIVIREPVSNQEWEVDVTANTVARRKAAVALVLDRSGSMSQDRGDGIPKYQSLQDAAELFVDVMQQDDALSLTRYDHDAQVVTLLTSVGPQDPLDPARNALKAAITGGAFAPAGATSIGDGIEVGRATVSPGAGYDVRALVVLTDGKENAPKSIAQVAAAIDARTFAIGLGTPQNTSIAALQAIAGNNGGYGLVTGSIGGDNLFVLQKYFLQILAGVTNTDIILDPRGELRVGSVHRIPFLVTEAEQTLDVIVISPLPRLLVPVVETPNGLVLDPVSTAGRTDVVFSTGRGHSMYRIQLPVELLPGRFEQEGTWHVVLQLDRHPDPDGTIGGIRRADTSRAEARRLEATAAAGRFIDDNLPRSIRDRRALPYSVVVHTSSDISLRASLRQSGHEPGASAHLEASLTQFSVPLETPATVRANVRRPDGSVGTIDLDRVEPGRYGAAMSMNQSGTYEFVVRATGASERGWAFSREQVLTAPVWHGGDAPVAGEPGLGDVLRHLTERDEAWCHVLRCLIEHGLSAPEIERELRRRGVDLKALLGCVDVLCRTHPDQPHTDG
jgi:Mg-chelatase subunit ChlD